MHKHDSPAQSYHAYLSLVLKIQQGCFFIKEQLMWNGEQKSDFIYSVTSFLSEIFPVSGKHVWTLCIEVPFL